MSDPVLKELALERYARLLRGAAGESCPVAYCSPSGDVLWEAGGADSAELAAVLAGLSDFEDGLPPGGEARWLDAGAARRVLYAPVRIDDSEQIGVLATLTERSPSESHAANLQGVLVDLAECIGREYRLDHEANSLATELSERYEELNLLYSMEGRMRAFEAGERETKSLLAGLAERLHVDFAAFVISDRPTPIHVATQPIPNLDLVLTAIRGDLFRFAVTGRAPIVLNADDDPRRQYLLVNMPYVVLACPVIDCGDAKAMLVTLRLEGPDFTNGDRNLGMVIANQTAVMMQNQTMLGSLERFSQQIAGSLIEAIEAKDPYTRGHSERVQALSVRLGRAAPLDEQSVEDLSWGALLHDVGKIGVPDSIICKAGKLTPDEYTMIKIHPERSYEIIRHIEDLSKGALEAARHHHERFDGNGYPSGLRGKQIPVEARVVSVADTYDALTSSRSYRDAMTHGAAMEIIGEVAGTQLDGEIVELLDRVLCREGGSADSAMMEANPEPEPKPPGVPDGNADG